MKCCRRLFCPFANLLLLSRVFWRRILLFFTICLSLQLPCSVRRDAMSANGPRYRIVELSYCRCIHRLGPRALCYRVCVYTGSGPYAACPPRTAAVLSVYVVTVVTALDASVALLLPSGQPEMERSLSALRGPSVVRSAVLDPVRWSTFGGRRLLKIGRAHV